MNLNFTDFGFYYLYILVVFFLDTPYYSTKINALLLYVQEFLIHIWIKSGYRFFF